MTSSEEGTSILSNEEREAILSRARSPLFWVGKFIPEEEVIDGEAVPLRELVFRYISKSEHTAEEIRDAMAFSHKLEKMIHEIELRIRHEDLTRSAAEALMDEMLGLMRAVDELRERGESAELRLQAMLSEVEEEKRWMDFIRRLI